MNTILKSRILFVINPSSGKGERGDVNSMLTRFSEEMGFEYAVYRTTGKEDEKEVKRYLEKFQPHTIIAVGGDGTVNMVAKILIGSDIRLGIIPAGSANGLAYNLGIPENFEAALKKNLQDAANPVDVIKMNGKHYCLHLGDIGLNARIVKRFEKEGSKGMLGYGKQLFKELSEGKTSFSFYIQVPGHRRKKMKAEMVVIANAKSFGTGAIINPTGKLNDGKFEIIIIRPYPWWFVATFIYAFFTGKLHKMKYIRVYSASEARITLLDPQEFQVDGEVLPKTELVEAEIIPAALMVIGA
ncbi:diacylglycerol/lipid kinase family protein [Mariniphaga sediminis]|uniref:diacylglycerol/lipid kinase family protein n=1 Tax=Mariniphaga sediminis TaxID=1628158 RepID=UPI001558EB66|nr:diacylglycerol kinase family protein [Mariniphaga sediminis]